ncbi:hypothetical protein K402DRAFT_103628 [Aulographum hederae CBS 113979]|uniref:DUF7582 domain-containing protein n=1 Tax=Aulographum hederae CBS 113979 TaxID=1176131 RepID=A0A6G1GX62_9PEZI|nr:hypothetical protein K402DRAFT_103628 [Aulographum hederae CBS 113979]
MGCSSSKQTGHNQQPNRPQIGPPTDVTIHVPRNRVDASGQPIQQVSRDVDRPGMQQALGLMATYLHRKHAEVTAITVGGAVNCLLLQSRYSTHDVDIFGTNLDNRARMLLDEAMQYAIQHSPVALGTDWFNTETQMWMSPGMQRDLTEEALRQQIVVFRQPGLTLLAAPWGYAFGAKVQRLVTRSEQARPYDLDDAVSYLRQLVQRNEGRPATLQQLEDCARRYHQTTDARYLLESVNGAYERMYRSPGIVRSGGKGSRRR